MGNCGRVCLAGQVCQVAPGRIEEPPSQPTKDGGIQGGQEAEISLVLLILSQTLGKQTWAARPPALKLFLAEQGEINLFLSLQSPNSKKNSLSEPSALL